MSKLKEYAKDYFHCGSNGAIFPWQKQKLKVITNIFCDGYWRILLFPAMFWKRLLSQVVKINIVW